MPRRAIVPRDIERTAAWAREDVPVFVDEQVDQVLTGDDDHWVAGTVPSVVTLAPTMIATASSIEWLSGVTMAAQRPRRWMKILSASSNTCGMLWLMRITPRPRRRRLFTSSSTWCDSRTPSAAVGSSRMTTFVPNAAARATATAWR